MAASATAARIHIPAKKGIFALFAKEDKALCAESVTAVIKIVRISRKFIVQNWTGPLLFVMAAVRFVTARSKSNSTEQIRLRRTTRTFYLNLDPVSM